MNVVEKLWKYIAIAETNRQILTESGHIFFIWNPMIPCFHLFLQATFGIHYWTYITIFYQPSKFIFSLVATYNVVKKF